VTVVPEGGILLEPRGRAGDRISGIFVNTSQANGKAIDVFITEISAYTEWIRCHRKEHLAAATEGKPAPPKQPYPALTSPMGALGLISADNMPSRFMLAFADEEGPLRTYLGLLQREADRDHKMHFWFAHLRKREGGAALLMAAKIDDFTEQGCSFVTEAQNKLRWLPGFGETEDVGCYTIYPDNLVEDLLGTAVNSFENGASLKVFAQEISAHMARIRARRTPRNDP